MARVSTRVIVGLWLSMYTAVMLVLLSGCLGSISVKEFDATACGTLDYEECKKLYEDQKAKEELAI